MTIFRSPMEKILQEQEDGEIITNPKEPVRTSYRKLTYKFGLWFDRLRRFFGRANEDQESDTHRE